MVSDARAKVEAPIGVEFDPAACIEDLAGRTREAIRELGRGGAVVAVSGGIDSSAVAGVCVRALGAERVLLLRLPERDAGTTSSDLGLELAEALGAPTVEEPITDALEALGCYRRRDEAIRKLFPDYEPDWRHKVVRSAPTGGITFFSLVVEPPGGEEEQRRMPPDAYRELIAATNMKQRVRKLLEYSWADQLGYAVAGTPNLLEYDQGFFVKGGDGLADLTDTFSLPQTQEEFYFGHPYDRMDVLMWGHEHGVSPEELAPRAGIEPAEVEVAYREIDRRRVATQYLQAPAILFDDFS
jgi:NAD+ synthase